MSRSLNVIQYLFCKSNLLFLRLAYENDLDAKSLEPSLTLCISDSLLTQTRQAIENLATNLQCQRDELVSLSAYFYSFGWKKAKKSFGHNMEEKLVRLSSLLSRISRVFSPKRITKKGFA